ncbi:MAG: lysylphosphatidylglycerol synthase transmembrane domain-containing protein [Acidimicrobiia bacterium]
MRTVAPDPTPVPDPQFEPDVIVGYVRSPSDVLRLMVYGTLAVALLGITRWAHDALLGFESDVLDLFGFVGPDAERALAGITRALAVIAGFGVFVVPLVLRRLRLLGYLVIANVVSSLLVTAAVSWLDLADPTPVANQVAARAGVDLEGVLTPSTLATVAASFVILAPFLSHRWRRAGAVTIVVFALLRLVLSAQLPAEVFFALALGAAVGAAVLLAFGRPDQHPTMAAIAASLSVSGFAPKRLDPSDDDSHGSRVYRATLTDDAQLVAKVRSPAERSADLLYRVYRYLRFKNVGDERPFSSLRRSVEHEALVALQARDVGVRTPRLRAIAEVGTDSMLLAYDDVDGTPLDDLPDGDVDDRLLCSIWAQAAILRRHRIAHRDLHHANVVVDAHHDPWLIDFAFAEVAVADSQLDSDVAELLAALALVVGVTRAVDTAMDGIGADAVRAALPRLQPNALSGSTRAALRRRHGLLKELQKAVAERCHVSEPEFVPLARIDRKTVVTAVMLVLVTYFLLPQVADLPAILDQVRDANWVWFVPVVAASMLTYVGATTAIEGSVPEFLRVIPTFLAQVAASFAGTLAPASVGGLALNVRYLQKSGIDPAVAVPAVGLNAVAGFAVHILMLVGFLVWAGRSAFGSIKLPDPQVLVYGVAVVGVLAVVTFAIPWVRRTLAERLVPVLRRSASGLGVVLRQPLKLALLLGGSFIVTSGYVTAMYFSTRAFGGDLTFAQVGAVYLVGSAVASAAPTPGGLGALEAAVIAGLVAAGMPNSVAVPAVFLFRLATFWFPILPGWGSFTYMQREDYL